MAAFPSLQGCLTVTALYLSCSFQHRCYVGWGLILESLKNFFSPLNEINGNIKDVKGSEAKNIQNCGLRRAQPRAGVS